MKINDYYAESVTSNITNKAGKDAKNLKVVAQSISPFKATGAVMAVGGGINGFVNFKKYKKGKITKKQAITATVSESVGIGLAVWLGILVDGMLTPFVLATAAPPVLPFAVGVAVTMTTKIAWDRKTKN